MVAETADKYAEIAISAPGTLTPAPAHEIRAATEEKLLTVEDAAVSARRGKVAVRLAPAD